MMEPSVEPKDDGNPLYKYTLAPYYSQSFYLHSIKDPHQCCAEFLPLTMSDIKRNNKEFTNNYIYMSGE